MKLHIGCGRSRLEGFVNCDLTPGPMVDAAFDCQKTWPFPDNAALEVYASHLLEHLDDPLTFFQEAWRVLRPDGALTLRVPYGGHKAAWWDLTHRRPWFSENFCFFQPGYSKAVGNPQSETWTHYFGLYTVDVRVSGKFARPLRWRWFRRWFLAFADNIENAFEELYVFMYALKTPEAIAEYERTHIANVVPTRYVICKHHLEGRSLPMGALADHVNLMEFDNVNGFHAWRW